MFPSISRRVINLYRGEAADIGRLLLKKQFIKGPHIDIFERNFAQFTGAKHAVAVASGRLSLYVILKVLDLPQGGEVILSAYEDMSVPQAIVEAGLRPVFVDIDRMTQNLDPSKIQEKLTDKTAAIVVAHIFGNPVDVPGIRAVLGGRKIAVIEDCAHALGTLSSGKHVGNSGDIAFFSFNSTKPFSCFGGGMITTEDEKIYQAVKFFIGKLPDSGHFSIIKRMLSAYLLFFLTSGLIFSCFILPCLNFLGWIKAEPLTLYQKFFKGSKKSIAFSKFSNIQAWIGIKNLKDLEKHLAFRKQNVQKLEALLRREIPKPVLAQGCNYYFFILFSKERDAFRKKILKEGLDSGKLLMRNCAFLFGVNERFPNTDAVRDESVQIPVHEGLSLDQIEKVARIINRLYVC